MTPSPRSRWLALMVVLLIVVGVPAGLVAGGGIWLRRSVAPVGGGAVRLVEIPSGQGTDGIAQLLKEQGLIRNELAFRLALKQWGLAGQLKAGHYNLSPEMSAHEIARTIAEGDVATVRVTIPEGFIASQIAEEVEAAGLCSASEFLDPAVVQRVREEHPFVTNDRMEGYLFPDTYVIELGSKPEQLVLQMVGNFHQRVVVGMEKELERSQYSLGEIVTIASMIEREARVAKDRPLIAGVIHNRLAKDMRLQIDATVIYALGEHRERLTLRDLKVDSPFNTYRYKGLPPHPICNPGEASIRAALKPAKTDYLYYVARPDGSHVFTKTYEEHKRAIRAIRGGGD